jgi:hypothetical protein
MRAFVAHSLIRTLLRGEIYLLGGELAQPHARVARVSRLIGNLDTTGKVHLWQVKAMCEIIFGNTCGEPRDCSVGRENAVRESRSERRNATPCGVAFRSSRAGHWPPRQIESGACFLCSGCGLLGGFSLLRAARWRLLLPSARCCSGSLSVPLSGRHITGTDNVAIGVPFETFFLFKWLYETRRAIVSILEVKRRNSFKKA